MKAYYLVRNFIVFVTTKLHKVTYYNTDKIPQNKGYIICANHRTFWDPLLLMAHQPQKIYFMAKDELFKNRIFGFLLKQFGAFPVNRAKHDLSSIKHTLKLIDNNNPVVIFPEGTRSKTGEFLKPKSGAALIAHKTQKEILPVKIVYHEPIKLRSKIDVIFGDLIKPDELGLYNPSLKEIKKASLLIMEQIKKLDITR